MIEPAAELGRVLDDHPDLCDAGFRTFDMTAERFETYRRWLSTPDATTSVLRCAVWLQQNLPPGDAPGFSYRLKHLAEEEEGHYVSNGELILAALWRGYEIAIHPNGLNAYLGVSRAALRAAERRRQGRHRPDIDGGSVAVRRFGKW